MARANAKSIAVQDKERAETVAVYRETGGNMSETARRLGVSRQAIQDRIKAAKKRGEIEEWETHDPNVPRRDDYLAARERKIAAYQKKKRKGDWRKPVVTTLPEKPFRLKLFGDPHLDADGCNFELFEQHWMDLDAENGVYGMCIGDWFNNWLKALAHLWREESTHPSDAWLCLEYLMEQRGGALIAACSGNHDDWTHGPTDPVDLLMKKYGVLYRQGALRVMVKCGGLEPFFIALRHKWRGNSMYSAAHWGVRANREGWRDLILVGGHIHQDEPRLVSHPDGFRSHVCQISAFKEFDTFADVHGLNGPKISPVWELVIDPREPDTSPDKVKTFWDSERAQNYLEAIT